MTLYVSTDMILSEEDMDYVRVIAPGIVSLRLGHASLKAAPDASPHYLADTFRRLADDLDAMCEAQPAKEPPRAVIRMEPRRCDHCADWELIEEEPDEGNA